MEGAQDLITLNEEIKNDSAFIDLIQNELSKVIVGQKGMAGTYIVPSPCSSQVKPQSSCEIFGSII